MYECCATTSASNFAGWVGGENEQPDRLAAAAAARCPSWASVSSCARVSFRMQMSLRCAVIIRLVVPSRGGRMTPRIVNGKLVYPPPSRDSREVITWPSKLGRLITLTFVRGGGEVVFKNTYESLSVDGRCVPITERTSLT